MSNQTEKYIKKGLFSIDDVDKIRLHGNYKFKIMKNEATVLNHYDDHPNTHCLSLYEIGNVLLRTDTEEIEQLIDVFIRYTHDPCKDLELKIINETDELYYATRFPDKKNLFKYKAKVFVAYARYVFGYKKHYVDFRREYTYSGDSSTVDEQKPEVSSIDDEENSSDSSSDMDYFSIRQDKIKQDKIILKNIDQHSKFHHDDIYSFCIYDEETGVLDAFGLYR